MRRFLDGVVLDSYGLWFAVALLMLFTMLVWGAIQVQDHYYFATTPFSWMGVRVP